MLCCVFGFLADVSFLDARRFRELDSH